MGTTFEEDPGDGGKPGEGDGLGEPLPGGGGLYFFPGGNGGSGGGENAGGLGGPGLVEAELVFVFRAIVTDSPTAAPTRRIAPRAHTASLNLMPSVNWEVAVSSCHVLSIQIFGGPDGGTEVTGSAPPCAIAVAASLVGRAGDLQASPPGSERPQMSQADGSIRRITGFATHEVPMSMYLQVVIMKNARVSRRSLGRSSPITPQSDTLGELLLIQCVACE